MYIHPETGTLYLDPGETYVEECVDPGNITRTATITMPNGMEIKMVRSYAHIRPDVFNHEGKELKIELDQPTGTLQVKGIASDLYPARVKEIKARMASNKIAAIANMLSYRASNINPLG